MTEHMVKKCIITDVDHFDFENNCRKIVSDLLNPCMLKLNDVERTLVNIRVETERQRKFVIENMDWVRARGDANRIEDLLAKRILESEKNVEISHDALSSRFDQLRTEMQNCTLQFHRSDDQIRTFRVSCDMLREEHCKMVALTNAFKGQI